MSDKATYFLIGAAVAAGVAIYLKRRSGCGCGGADHAAPPTAVDGDEDEDDDGSALSPIAGYADSVRALLAKPISLVSTGCGR